MPQELLPPLLDELFHGRIAAHFVVHAEVSALRDDHSHDLEVVAGPSLSTLTNRLDAACAKTPVKLKSLVLETPSLSLVHFRDHQ
jgi:hypothetical protein